MSHGFTTSPNTLKSSVYSPVLTNLPLYMSVIANNLTNELKVIHQFDQELHVYSLTT